MSKKVLVIAGGISSEKDISLQSGKSAIEALNRLGYQTAFYQVTENIFDFVQYLHEHRPDVVVNMLHGRFGEDGNIQGLLNLMQIPYTHSGCLASALSMDKHTAKKLFKAAGIPVATDKMVTIYDIRENNTLPYPYVIKPNNEGSSVGVFIIESEADKNMLLTNWPFNGGTVMMEEYVRGREMSVAVLNDQALGIVEIIPASGFFDFHNKYTTGGARHLIPAPVDKAQEALLKEYAVKAHRALGCKGMSRTDFRFDDTNKDLPPRIVALELNSQPGMTSLSLVPDIAKSVGISYDQLIQSLVEAATCEK